MSGWGCPHEVRGTCARVLGRDCDPGMKGCILSGRFEFATESKNRPPKKPRPATPTDRDKVRGEGGGKSGA